MRFADAVRSTGEKRARSVTGWLSIACDRLEKPWRGCLGGTPFWPLRGPDTCVETAPAVEVRPLLPRCGSPMRSGQPAKNARGLSLAGCLLHVTDSKNRGGDALAAPHFGPSEGQIPVLKQLPLWKSDPCFHDAVRRCGPVNRRKTRAVCHWLAVYCM